MKIYVLFLRTPDITQIPQKYTIVDPITTETTITGLNNPIFVMIVLNKSTAYRAYALINLKTQSALELILDSTTSATHFNAISTTHFTISNVTTSSFKVKATKINSEYSTGGWVVVW